MCSRRSGLAPPATRFSTLGDSVWVLPVLENDRVWQEVHDKILEKVRERDGRNAEPSAAVMDSQSVKMLTRAKNVATTPARTSRAQNVISSSTRWACFSQSWSTPQACKTEMSQTPPEPGRRSTEEPPDHLGRRQLRRRGSLDGSGTPSPARSKSSNARPPPRASSFCLGGG